MPDLAWQNVINSFSKARISKGRQNSTLLGHDDPIKGFQEQIKKVTITNYSNKFLPKWNNNWRYHFGKGNAVDNRNFIHGWRLMHEVMDGKNVDDSDDNDGGILFLRSYLLTFFKLMTMNP